MVTAVDTSRRAWTSPAVDGEIYGEPLVWDGRIYAATENDTVYALSARTGTVAWSVRLGSPVPAASLPCGDIRPAVGITGTPVIDQSRTEIFVVADEDRNGTAAHILAGLNTSTGRVEMTRDVDPPGARSTARIVYLLSGAHLGGIGGQLGQPGVGLRQRHRRRRRGRSDDGLSPLYRRCHRGSGHRSPAGLRLLWTSGISVTLS